MGNFNWANVGTDPTSAGNWVEAAVPGTNDNVYINATAAGTIVNIDASIADWAAKKFTSVNFGRSWATGQIVGGQPWRFGASKVVIASGGAAVINLKNTHATDAWDMLDIRPYDVNASITVDAGAHGVTAARAVKGIVTLSAGTFAEANFEADQDGLGANLNLICKLTGATLTLCRANGGTYSMNAGALTKMLIDLGLLTVTGGTLTAAEIRNLGQIDYRHTATIASLVILGRSGIGLDLLAFDSSSELRAHTITDMRVGAGAPFKLGVNATATPKDFAAVAVPASGLPANIAA